MAANKLQPVRGTRDILASESTLHSALVNMARDVAHCYGYDEIILPIFEFSEIFHRSLGETSDILSKETYTFMDREKTSLTLRPEFTAQVVRSLGTAGLLQSMPVKFFSYGPLFRHERPQKCRYRQFHQVNFEYFGCNNPAADVEIIALAQQFLTQIDLNHVINLEINSLGDAASRQTYRAMLTEFLEKYKDELSPDSQRRLQHNPLRILDSKDATDREILRSAPAIEESYSPEARQYYAEVLAGLAHLNISYTCNPLLVRGMDYYNHTVFEFTTTQLGSQGTVLAGGRYDGLVKQMHNTAFPVPAIGFAAGVERLCALLMDMQINILPSKQTVAVIATEDEQTLTALQLANMLRANGLRVLQEFDGNMSKKMKKANKAAVEAVIIVGAQEMAANVVRVKNMLKGHEILLAMDEILGYLIKS